jgi:predicted RNase H-like nuclease
MTPTLNAGTVRAHAACDTDWTHRPRGTVQITDLDGTHIVLSHQAARALAAQLAELADEAQVREIAARAEALVAANVAACV